ARSPVLTIEPRRNPSISGSTRLRLRKSCSRPGFTRNRTMLNAVMASSLSPLHAGGLYHQRRAGPRCREEKIMSDITIGPIGQVSRMVSSIPTAEAWYGGTLGLRHLYTFGRLAFFDCGG